MIQSQSGRQLRKNVHLIQQKMGEPKQLSLKNQTGNRSTGKELNGRRTVSRGKNEDQDAQEYYNLKGLKQEQPKQIARKTQRPQSNRGGNRSSQEFQKKRPEQPFRFGGNPLDRPNNRSTQDMHIKKLKQNDAQTTPNYEQEILRLSQQVQRLKEQKDRLASECQHIKKEHEQHRQRMARYESNVESQSVMFRKRITNLQYELRECRSSEKRIYHLETVPQTNYQNFSPAFTVNRIDQANETQQESQLKQSAINPEKVLTEEGLPWQEDTSPIGIESSIQDKKEASTISDLSLESHNSKTHQI